MASRYWVGGTAAWDGTAGTKWSTTSGGSGGAAVPTSADDVFFNAASGASTVTISAGNTGAKTITCTGFIGTLTGTDPISVSGNMTLGSGMTYSYLGTITFTVAAVLTTNGISITSNITASSTLSLGSAFTITATMTANGNFSTSNYNVTLLAASFLRPGAGGTFTGGSSTITVNQSSFDLRNFTSLSVASTIFNLTGAGTGGNSTRFYGNGTIGTLTFNQTADGSSFFVGGNATYNSFKNNAQPIVINFVTGSVSTFPNGSWNINGTSGKVVYIGSDGGTFYLNGANGTLQTNTSNYVDIDTTTCVATYQTWNANNSTATTTSPPTVSGWNVSSGTTYYWVGGTGTWNGTTTTNWALSSGGAGGAGVPTQTDSVVFDANSNTGTNNFTVTLSTGATCFNLNTTGVDPITAMTVAGTGNLSFTGLTLTLTNKVAWTNTGAINFYTGSGEVTFTTAGISIASDISIQAGYTDVNLSGNLTLTGTKGLNILSGSFIAGANAVSLSYFNLTGSNANYLSKGLDLGTSSWTVSGAGSGAWDCSNSANFSVYGSLAAINMTSASAKTFNGSGYIWSSLVQAGSGALTIISNGTIISISNSVQPTTITFTSGQTISTTNFLVSGTAGNLVTINSTVAGSAAILSKTSGTVSCNYLSLKDSKATGGATWYAGANSTNVSGNTGWLFSNAPQSGGGSFLMLM